VKRRQAMIEIPRAALIGRSSAKCADLLLSHEHLNSITSATRATTPARSSPSTSKKILPKDPSSRSIRKDSKLVRTRTDRGRKPNDKLRSASAASTRRSRFNRFFTLVRTQIRFLLAVAACRARDSRPRTLSWSSRITKGERDAQTAVSLPRPRKPSTIRESRRDDERGECPAVRAEQAADRRRSDCRRSRIPGRQSGLRTCVPGLSAVT